MNKSFLQSTNTQSHKSVSHPKYPQVNIYNRYFLKRTLNQLLINEQHQKQINNQANIPKIIPQSYKYLTQKIQQNLINKIQALTTKSINVQHINQLILQFITQKNINKQDEEEIMVLARQVYLLVSKYNLMIEPNCNNIFILFRLMLDPYNHSSSQMISLLCSNHDYNNIQQLRKTFILQNPSYQDQIMKVEHILILFKKIKIKHQMFTKRTISSSLKKRDQYSFHPKISERSNYLANKNKNQYQKHQSKHNKIKKSTTKHEYQHNKRLDKSKIITKTQMDDQCTFQPNSTINTLSFSSISSDDVINRLYNIPVKSNRDWKKQQQEQQLKHCTFKPKKISKSPTRLLSKSVSVKNYQKSIKRMQKSRVIKNQKKQSFQSLGKVRNLNHKTQPPSICKIKQRLVILDVKISEQKIEKIKIYGNQNPKIIAKKFVYKYGLKKQMIDILYNIVKQCCSEYSSQQ